MKKSKRIIVFTIILFMAIFIFNFNSKVYAVEFDGDEIDTISYESENFHQYKENTDGNWQTDNNGEDFFNYSVYGFQGGDILTINLKNGSSRSFTFCNENEKYGFYDGEEELGGDYSITADQWENHWYLNGENNYVIISYQGVEVRHYFTMIVNPVTSISYEPASPYVYVENVDGYYEEDGGDRYFVYDINAFRSGDRLIVEYADQSIGTVTYTYGTYGNGFRTSQGEELGGDIYYSHDQSDNHWTINQANHFCVRYMERECEVPVQIIQDPISEILYVPATEYSFIEDTHGYLTDSGYYYYFLNAEEGDVLTIKYTEAAGGGEKEFTLVNTNYWTQQFESNDGEVIEYDDVDFITNQETNHWTKNTTNYVTIKYKGHEVKKQVTITENPITSIKVKLQKPIVYYKEVQGYWNTTSRWNSQTQQYEEITYFHYSSNLFREGDILEINNVDYEYKWLYNQNGFTGYAFCNSSGEFIDGYDVLTNDDQVDNPWTVGGQNVITVSYMGRTDKVYVTIVENPVTSIDYIPKHDFVFIEGIDGEEETTTRWNDSTGQYEVVEFFYYWYTRIHTGDILVVNGVQYEYKGVYNEQEQYYDWGFFNQAGDMIDPSDVNIEDDQYETPWTKGGDNPITVKYMGRTKTLHAILKENTVTSFEYIPVNGKYTVIENIDGRMTLIEDGASENYFWYMTEFQMPGDKLIIHDAEGTKTYTYTYGSRTLDAGYYTENMQDYIDPGRVDFDTKQATNHWTLGTNNHVTVIFRNMNVDVTVEVIQDYIDYIEYQPIAPYQFTENTGGEIINVTDNNGNVIGQKYVYYVYGFRDGDKLIVHKKDSTTVTYTYKKSSEYDKDGFYLGDNIAIYSLDWFGVELYDGQYSDDTWEVGKDNYFSVYYKGREARVKVTILPQCEHETEIRNAKAATCVSEGYTGDKVCKKCGKVIENGTTIAKSAHTPGEAKITTVESTCEKEGSRTETVYCTVCGEKISENSIKLDKKEHTYVTTSVTTKATLTQNGKIVTTTRCSVCGDSKSETTTIAYPKTFTLSKTTFTYNKKIQKPKVSSVKDSNGKVIAASNYTVVYVKTNSKDVGRYQVKIIFKGNYSGTKTLTYDIAPTGTSLTKLDATSKGFTANWKKQTTQTTGYEIEYATSSNFKTGKKTVTISKNSTVTKKVSKLKAKKKYYVRIRTYKTVKFGGKNVKIYSSWSKVKNVTTKK